jgi:hypothetical protein
MIGDAEMIISSVVAGLLVEILWASGVYFYSLLKKVPA